MFLPIQKINRGRSSGCRLRNRAAKDERGFQTVLCASGRPHRGFTLLEMMLVIAIVALMVGLVVPNLKGRLDRDVFVEDVNNFVKTMRITANEAMYCGKSFVVILDIYNGYYTVYEKRADDEYGGDVEPFFPQRGLDYSYIKVAQYGDGSQQFSGEMKLTATPQGWSDSWLFEIIDLQERLKWVRADRMTTRVVQSDLPLEMMEALAEVSIDSSL